ncbi:MAG: TonB-dependent receptor domain-containing protein [Terriglobia bacterium]
MKSCLRVCVSSRWFLSLLVMGALLSWTLPSAAQLTASGQIEGVVEDPTGAVIPGARVTVRNVATDVTRVLTTDVGGRYRAVSLEPGDYEVAVEASGFRTTRRSNIRLEVGSTVTVNVTLEVGAVAQEVVVTEAAPLIDRESTEFTKTVNETSVANLPVNGRRFDRFVLLAPTVTADGNFGLISYRGISGLYNNNTIDGADNNQAFFSEARGRTRVVYTNSLASIKEFQVGVNNFSAEFGRAAGGTVNAVTKSGGNKIHGEAFYFIRDDAFNAQEPFNKAEDFDQLPERRQQFGFSVGGPFIKDKVFWFLNYDQQLRNFPGVTINEGTRRISILEPGTDLVADCDIPAVPGRCDAARALLLDQTGIFSRKGHNNVALGKVDWVPNEQHRISGQYNYHKWRSPSGIQTQDRTNDTRRANGFDGVRSDTGLARWLWLPTARTINEFRFQASRDFEFEFGNTTGPEITHNREIDLDDGQRAFLPRFAFPNEKRFQFVDNFTYIRGRHALKGGFDINYVRELQINLFRGNGDFEYRTFEAFARDVPLPGLPPDPDGADTGRHYRDFRQAFDRTARSDGKIFFTTTDWNFYVQDTFKIRPDLTLNFGLRYEWTDQPELSQSVLTGPLATPEFLSLPVGIQNQVGQINSDTNNFGPRIGIAWDVGGLQKMVVRAGYGLTYGRTSNSALAAGLFQSNALTQFAIRLRPGRNPEAPAFPNTFCDIPFGTPGQQSTCTPPAGVSGSTTLSLFSEDFVRPLIHMIEANVEYSLTANTSISASYVGARGQHLPAFVDINLPTPSGTVAFFDTAGNVLGAGFPFFGGDRPIDNFDIIIQSESTINSWYNGLVFTVKQRMTHGLQFESNFTVSKAIDDAQSSATFFAFFSDRVNPFDRSREKGLSRFDIRKRWVSHFYWDPPFQQISNEGVRKALDGFIFSGILTIQDGRAFGGDLDFFGFQGRTSPFTPNGSGADDRAPWLGRNAFTTTGLATFDFRVTREIPVSETLKVAFIWESFNLFNRTNFTRFENDQFDTVSTSVTGTVHNVVVEPILDSNGQPVFLVPQAASNTLRGPREMQFALKFIF